jgi:hypothetical protein
LLVALQKVFSVVVKAAEEEEVVAANWHIKVFYKAQ